jgi:hypothetical protein
LGKSIDDIRGLDVSKYDLHDTANFGECEFEYSRELAIYSYYSKFVRIILKKENSNLHSLTAN